MTIPCALHESLTVICFFFLFSFFLHNNQNIVRCIHLFWIIKRLSFISSCIKWADSTQTLHCRLNLTSTSYTYTNKCTHTHMYINSFVQAQFRHRNNSLRKRKTLMCALSLVIIACFCLSFSSYLMFRLRVFVVFHSNTRCYIEHNKHIVDQVTVSLRSTTKKKSTNLLFALVQHNSYSEQDFSTTNWFFTICDYNFCFLAECHRKKI